MDARQTIWFLVLALTLFAAFWDLRTRRIPNWLTVSAFCLGAVIRTWMGGWRGAMTALEGTALALGILLPLVLLRALGAGDWKLMGAVGAIVGPLMLLFILFASIFVSGFMAVVMMIQAKRVRATLRNLLVLTRGLLSFGLRASPEISLDNPALLKLPFGVAAAVGTLICFAAAQLGI